MPQKFEDGIDTSPALSVDGINVLAHAARHLVAGADPLPVATTLVAGLMSTTDKTKLDGILTSAAPIDVDRTAAVVGVATAAARADHKHDVSVGTPVATGTANAAGSASSLVLSDHVHRTLVAVQQVGVAIGSRPTLNFVSGATIADNPGSDRIDITVSGGAGMDRGRFSFGHNNGIPAAGSRQLSAAGPTFAGVRLNRAGMITGASVQTDAADGVRTYDMDMRVNGVSAATLTLATGNIGAHTTALAVGVVAGDAITVFMVRTAGAGASTPNEINSMVEVTF